MWGLMSPAYLIVLGGAAVVVALVLIAIVTAIGNALGLG